MTQDFRSKSPPLWGKRGEREGGAGSLHGNLKTTNRKATGARRESSKPPEMVLQVGDQGSGQAQEAIGDISCSKRNRAL